MQLEYKNQTTDTTIKLSVDSFEEASYLQDELRRLSSSAPDILVIDYPFREDLKETLTVRELNWIINNQYHPNALEDHILMLESGTLSDDEFWSIIELMDWNSDLDHERIARELKGGVYGARGRALAISKKFTKLKSALYEEIDKQIEYKGLDYNEIIDLGDDGFDDLLSQIIGSGRKMYNKAFKDPVFAGKQPTNESFAYSFNSL